MVSKMVLCKWGPNVFVSQCPPSHFPVAPVLPSVTVEERHLNLLLGTLVKHGSSSSRLVLLNRDSDRDASSQIIAFKYSALDRKESMLTVLIELLEEIKSP